MKLLRQLQRPAWLAAVAVLNLFCANVVSAEGQSQQTTGVTDKEIDIGSCVALTGALAERGNQVTTGANAYLSYINDQGGVNGRKIKLLTCDDSYESEKAIQCFNGCLKDKVFAGAFFVGSAPISKYVRMGDSMKMPMLGFCTGTPSVYENHPTEFVLRAGYNDEVQKLVEELVGRGVTKFAIIYQNDAFGAAVRETAMRILQSSGMHLVAEASYARNSQPAEAQAAYNAVRAAKPEVVLMGATSSSLTNVIKKRDEDKYNALFVTVSTADDYLAEMGKNADGVILTQVAPPFDPKLPAFALYTRLLSKYKPGAKPNASSFEAFLNAQILVEGLKRSGRDLTREKFVKALESIHDYDLGAGQKFRVNFAADNHRGFAANSVYFTVVRNGNMASVTDSDWKQLIKAAKSPEQRVGYQTDKLAK
jgi:ABC-type branched-subunit amino acid transport system substrate-binding protein